MTEDRPFIGKVAVVTGGSRGIGRACVLKLAQLGADVAVNYSRNTEDAEATARDAEEFDGNSVAIKADMGDRDAIVALFQQVQEKFGRVDILVNSAARGLERPRGAVDSLPKHLKHSMDVNLFGPWFCSQEAAKLMTSPSAPLRTGAGAIVNIHSPGSERYMPRYAPVGVSKGALASLTTYLAVELAPRGIRVNAVTSGLVDGSDGIRMLDEQLLERYREVAPAGRLVRPEEVAAAVAFLCGEDASMIIGHVLTVDGGYSLVGLL